MRRLDPRPRGELVFREVDRLQVGERRAVGDKRAQAAGRRFQRQQVLHLTNCLTDVRGESVARYVEVPHVFQHRDRELQRCEATTLL